MSDEDDYEVGYAKPPQQHQFKPGGSGNPKGRPRGSKNLATLARAAMNEKVTVTIGGRSRTMTKGKASMVQQANKAAGGELKAAKAMVDWGTRGDLIEAGSKKDVQLTPAERRAYFNNVLKMLRAQADEGGDGGSEDIGP